MIEGAAGGAAAADNWKMRFPETSAAFCPFLSPGRRAAGGVLMILMRAIICNPCAKW